MTPPPAATGHEHLIARGVSKMKYFSFLLLFFVSCFLFFGCDDAEMMIEPVIDTQVDSEPVSGYTGVLHRVGTVERFGIGANDAMALEWNGTDLYMLAEYGRYPNEGSYLFRVDKETGIAGFVNTGARDLGGSFTQGRTFSRVLYVRPSDLTWSSLNNKMFASCYVIDEVVSIGLDSGAADRTGGELSYCSEDREGIPQVFTIGYDGLDFYTLAKTHSVAGRNIFGLFRFSGSFGCVYPVAEGITFQLDKFYPDSMCWIENEMYVSERANGVLCIIDLETGELKFVARWTYDELPPDHYIHSMSTGEDSGFTQMPVDHDGSGYQYVNRGENLNFTFPSIRGIAFNGQNMYVVDYYTDALYRVGRN